MEDILGRVDIAELIGGYIPLKRAGRNFKALCPFHHEKTPSFMISPDRQIYHCFGCSAGGNAFNFLMQYERMEFLEAVEFLAKKAGVALPEKQKDAGAASSLTTELYKINELAAAFYENNLRGPDAAPARNYLIKRGITQETAKLLKLGYAVDRWDALINHLRAKGFSLSLIEKAGAALPRDSGGYYDRFRNRIIFPIFDVRSRVIAFGARILQSAHQGQAAEAAKYVNSPETPIYTKGRNLYGLHLSKDAIRSNDCAVIVEGYLDFIIPFTGGLQNIVASSGTALTTEQARLLKRYTQNVVVVYDGDSAGEMATLRTLDIFIEEGMEVRVVSLPAGFDPDSFVRKYGIEELKDKVKHAANLFDYKLKVLKSRHNHRDPQAKARISAEILLTIAKIENAVLKSEYIKRLAQELDTEQEALLQELKKVKKDPVYASSPQVALKKLGQVNPTEKLLIKLMLEEKALIEQIRSSLEPGDFRDERASRIVSVMFDLMAQGKDIEPNSLINHCDDETLTQVICESMLLPEMSSQDRDKVIKDCIQRLKGERLKLKKQHLHEEIKSAQHLGDELKLNRLIQEFHELIKSK